MNEPDTRQRVTQILINSFFSSGNRTNNNVIVQELVNANPHFTESDIEIINMIANTVIPNSVLIPNGNKKS
jgi:hypothetical protein